MTEQLKDEQKYQYIKDKYGKDADKILSEYGALAYDIDKYLSKNSKGIVKDLRYRGVSGKDILVTMGAAKNHYIGKNMIDKSKKEYNDTKKVAAIKEKYGEKADVILAAYGPMAKDIDDNFSKFYNKKVFLGRNYWMDQKETQERSSLGAKNHKLFEEGKLPVDEAARIVNCPAYFGSMSSTVEKISTEIKQSATTYRAHQQPSPQIKQPPIKEQTAPEKAPEKQKSNMVKKELKNQRTIAELKPVIADEVTVTAYIPKEQQKLQSKLDIKLAEKPDFSKIEIKVKSPAEVKYDNLLAAKMEKMPDDVMGKKAPEIGLTIGELMDLGVDPKGDFQSILKSMDPAAAQKLVPETGFKDENVVVNKELAIAAIERVQIRDMQKQKGKQRA
ncbi:MAG: hypothetical protein NC218_09025 [Acetobacter sp.]|nr:hypothetical protein [Acetobacter sp.]